MTGARTKSYGLQNALSLPSTAGELTGILRKLEQGPVDHEVEFKCKVYENGRVAADAETLRQLARYSERQIRVGTGLRRDTIRLIRHGTGVKRSTYQRVIEFLKSEEQNIHAIQRSRT